MTKVIDLSNERFQRVNASKIVNACNTIDKIVLDMLYDEKIPANELLPALCQRIGHYLSLTDAKDKEKVSKKLYDIIYKNAKIAE